MKTTTMDKYIIRTDVYDRKDLTIVENKETGHWGDWRFIINWISIQIKYFL